MSEDDVKKLTKMFKFVCLKCGSDKVSVSAEEGYGGSEETAWCAGSLSIGCNGCEENDFHANI